ncbi:MAG: PDZ domain-containing protein [Ruminococcaceae bacterium]|nr:PDZ domain-containing protein [Oscillospiraceae bacterium]
MDYNNFDFNNQTFGNDEFPEFTPKREKKKNGGNKYSLLTVIICTVLAAVIGATSAAGVIINYKNSENAAGHTESTSENSTQNVTNINIEETVESVIEAVAKKVTPSVVGIATSTSINSFFGGSTESTGTGSGVIYSADGYIITNYHVIESTLSSASSKIEVYLTEDTEKSYEASVVGYNITHDLAVIKINAKNLPKIEVGDIDDVKVGQYVAAIGSPGGLEFMGSVTYGIISGLNRMVSDNSTEDNVNLIQTDAAINPGNSGGALVNTKGQLIGINSSKIAATEYEGMGFAIPIDTVVEVCDKIISRQYDPNPYIGVTINEKYTQDILERLGYPSGAVVKSVMNGGPAYNSGIRSGDIITQYGETKITDYSKLNDAVAASKPGQTVKVKIYRSGKYYYANITVGSNNSQ